MGKEYQKETAIRGNIPTAPSIIFYDDIEGAFKWTGEGAGTDWIVDKFAGTKEVNNGNYCLRMCTKATAPAIGDWVQAIRYSSLRTGQIIRFSCFFYPETKSTYNRIAFGFAFYTSTNVKYVTVQWKKAYERWEYYDVNNTWQPIPNSSQTLYENAHHYVSFVVDVGKTKLQQLQCDNLFLNNLDLMDGSAFGPLASHLRTGIYLESEAASVQKIYIDDIIVEEPS